MPHFSIPIYVRVSQYESSKLETNNDPQSDDQWHLVDERRMVLRSAFVDLGVAREVRILAEKHCRDKREVKCIFHAATRLNAFVVKGTYDMINTPNDTDCDQDSYEHYYIICPLPPVPPTIALLRLVSILKMRL